jgi:signal transduction histidine kinase
VLVLLPVAVFLLVLLSVFTLFSYRSGIALLVEERQGEALKLAQRVAEAVASGEHLDAASLREWTPGAKAAAVTAPDGAVRARAGSLPDEPLLAPIAGASHPTPRAVGPAEGHGDDVVALVPIPAGAAGAAGASAAGGDWVRVDLGAPALALQRRSARVLTWVVLSGDAALALLVILFLGHMLAPIDRLLERARLAGETPPDRDDEIPFLIDTFERALRSMARVEGAGADEDIAVLQRTLGASFESGVLLLDREGTVLAVNGPGAELLELAEAEPAKPAAEVLAGHPALARLVGEAVAGERGVRRRELAAVTPSGRHLTLGLTVHPLRRDDGTSRGFLVLFADLTEVRRRAEQARLAESLQQIGELAAGVAHEMRNSLATLKGYLTLIERSSRPEEPRAAEGDDVADYVGEIRRETDHLQRVLEDFLSFARPGTVRMEEVDLHRIVARAAADPVLAGAPVTVAPRGEERCTLLGDPQLLERAFRNLLHNAAEAAREAGGGAVEVAAGRTGEGLEVTVADRGPGVPAELRERLFQPFSSGRPGGVGLGLALARRIVVVHGGRLDLEDRPGGGTVARVALPTGENATEGND